MSDKFAAGNAPFCRSHSWHCTSMLFFRTKQALRLALSDWLVNRGMMITAKMATMDSAATISSKLSPERNLRIVVSSRVFVSGRARLLPSRELRTDVTRSSAPHPNPLPMNLPSARGAISIPSWQIHGERGLHLVCTAAVHGIDHVEHRQVDRQQNRSDRSGQPGGHRRLDHAQHDVGVRFDLTSQVGADVNGRFRQRAGLLANNDQLIHHWRKQLTVFG